MRHIFRTLFVLVLFFHQEVSAFEAIGGHITWSCTGTGRFVFQLVLYRDCNGNDLTAINETIRVWNHATVDSINVKFSSRVNLSPACLSVGTALPLDCGSGAAGGNGPGALEKITYLSDPLDLPGIPPAEGWVFTFETTARMASVSNLQSPDLNGMTLVSRMFKISTAQNACLDNSPKIMNDPQMTVCSGSEYLFMPDYQEVDLDSVVVSWAKPWNNFPGGFYEDGVVPAAASYAPGFQFNNPTPGTSVNSANISAGMNAEYGDIGFTSFTSGTYVLKQLITTYRNGQRIADVEHEYTVYIKDCAFSNTAPQVAGPFSGGFDLTVTANTPVNFSISSTDAELLQDGTAQSNLLTASGAFFGTNFTSSNGCPVVPCANLNTSPVITGVQGVSTNFSWTPSCDHLKNNFGNEFQRASYSFVFRFQDDVCPFPAFTYKRVIITVETQVTLSPAAMDCIEVLPNGDLNISWTEAIDPNNEFIRYELHSVESGLINTFNTINTATTSLTPASAGEHYFIKTYSGNPCAIALNSDTITPINLDVISTPGTGTALLKWNSPYFNNQGHTANVEILREYPVGSGNWSLVGQTSFPAFQYFDTIDICSADLNYQIRINDGGCSHLSSIDGDFFTDEIPPTGKPVIGSVSIDTATNRPVLNWSQASEPDTYGYIIYFGQNSSEVDTAVGLTNTTYTYALSNEVDSVSFSVSAIDSCLIPGKTSPESERHTTSFLKGQYDLCARQLKLNWTPYIGWDELSQYRIWIQVNNTAWQLIDSVNDLSYQLNVLENSSYRVVVEAEDSIGGNTSFSNSYVFFAKAPSRPAFHYTRTATVEGDDILVRHHVQKITGITGLQLERLNDETGDFDVVGLMDYGASIPNFLDTEVEPAEKPYTYQVRLIDSCGNPTAVSNQVTTIHLKVLPDHFNMTNHLTWTPYIGFNGPILYYNVYRGIEGVFGTLPEAIVPPDQTWFFDTLFSNISFNGRICYYVEAVEAINVFGFSESSASNVACSVLEPLIYIPNSFTPDGDGLNEKFAPSINEIELESFELAIIDRWGEIIYHSFDQYGGWDGNLNNKACQPGIYQFVLKVKDGNGQEISERGFVNLIR